MKRSRGIVLIVLMAGALAFAATPALGVEGDHYPSVTSIVLGVDHVVISHDDPCAVIPVTVGLDQNETTVDQVKIPIENEPHEPLPKYVTVLTPTPGATSVSGTLNYCATQNGVGAEVVGDIALEYRAVGNLTVAGTVIDPTYTTFDAQQESTAMLSGRHHKATKHKAAHVTLTASERYLDYYNGYRHSTTSQLATLQRRTHGKWMTIVTKKPSHLTGAAVFTMKTGKRHTYRATFAPSPSIAASTSRTLTI